MSGNSTVIGNLRVVLGLDSAQFESGMKKSAANANAGASSIGKGIKAGLAEVGGVFEGLASNAGAVGVALTAMGVVGVGVAAALGGSFAQVRAALAFGDEIGDTANKIGVSTDALQEYRYAVHQLGGDYADADTALEQFSRAFGEAHAELSKRAAKPFAALGLDPQSFKSTDDALQAVIQKIAALKSSAEQAAIADKLGLTAMLPAIRAGVDEMDQLREKAHALGFVMDADLISRAGEANDKFEDLQHIVGVQLHSAFVDLAPVLLSLTSLIADMAKGVAGMVDGLKALPDKTSDGLRAERNRLQTYRLQNLPIFPTTPEQKNAASKIEGRIAEIDGLLASRAATQAAASAPRMGTDLAHVGVTDKSAQIAAAGDAAIAAAAKAELAARQALTSNIEQVAALKADEVKQDAATANQRLQDQVAAGKITAAAAATASALNNRAQIEKLALIQRQKEADLAAAAAQQEGEIGKYRQQIYAVQAQFASTAQARAAIELKALAEQQKTERDQQKAALDSQVAQGVKTKAQADQLKTELALSQIAQTQKAEREAQVAIAKEATQREQDALARQIDLAQAQAGLAQTVIARRQAELRLLALQKEAERKQLEKITVENGYSAEEEADAKARLGQLDEIYGAQQKVIERQNSLGNAFHEASDRVVGMADAIKRHDWVSLFDDLQKAIEDLQAAFASGDLTTEIAAVGGVISGVGQVIGGKAGKAISSAANGAVAGAQLGSMFGPEGAAIGAAAGAIVGGLTSLVGGKPSNHGAIATINGDYVSVAGNKRTSETSSAASSAAGAVLKGEDLLKSLGVALGTTVKSIDLGTRDLTHIFLSNGQELRSAVGDTQAAAEAALKAVLDGATYVDDAQKKLVDNMEAAGAGFDDIAAALQNYAAAQQVGASLADQILQLTDPEAYDKKQVTDAIQAQRDSLAAAAEQGYYTADQLAALNAQLDKLQGLQLDQVLLKYADASNDLAQRQQDAADAVTQAKEDLKAAYDAQAATLNDTIKTFGALSTSLHKFSDSLATSSTSPAATLDQARTAFAAIAGKTDAASLGKLQDVGQAYVEAAKAGATSSIELARVQAQVRAAANAGASAADAQVSMAQQQLDALNAQVSGLIAVNDSVLTVAAAIGNLQAALVGQARVTDATPATANDNIDVAKYLADNPDLQANWDAGGILRTLGTDLTSAARQHYLQQGQYEIAAGLRKFATGGGFQVGGIGGTDSKLAQVALTPGEYVNVTHGDSIAAMAAQIGALAAALSQQGGQLATLAKIADDQRNLLVRVTRNGDALVTVAA